jgi:hypothetical protein
MQIAMGFGYLELAFRAIFHERFHHVFQSIEGGLSGLENSYARVADDFLVHTSEKVLTSWGRVVRTQSRSLLYPEISLREVDGCIWLLKEMLSFEFEKVAGVEGPALDKEFRDREVEPGPSLKQAATTPTGSIVKLTKNTCTHFFAGGLKMIDLKSKVVVKCSHSPCSRDHIRPSLVTKEEAIDYTKTHAMKVFRKEMLVMIEVYPNFKV